MIRQQFYVALSPDRVVRRYAHELAVRLERECDVPNLLTRSPPHITLVPRFTLMLRRQRLPVIAALLEHANASLPFLLTVRGPAWFPDDDPENQTLFLAVEKHERLTAFAESLRSVVERSTRASIRRQPDFVPHISVARHLSRAQAARVREYLGDVRERFDGMHADVLVVYRRTTEQGRPVSKGEQTFMLRSGIE